MHVTFEDVVEFTEHQRVGSTSDWMGYSKQPRIMENDHVTYHNDHAYKVTIILLL